MKEAQRHTEGPWEEPTQPTRSAATPPAPWSYRDGTDIVQDAEGNVVCYIPGLFSRRLATGKLIVKAPEMLEVLRDLVCDGEQAARCSDPEWTALEIPRTVISRARAILEEIDGKEG